MTRFLRGVAFFYYYFYYYDLGVLISTHIADASAATILPEEQFQKINSPKDQLKKLTNLVLLLLNVYYIERRERGKSTYPKTYNNTCLILFPLGSKIGGRVSSIFFLLSNSRVSVWVISNYVGLE